MKRILNHAAVWAVGLLPCLAAMAQTPPDTNTVQGAYGQPQVPASIDTNTIPPGWSPLTNQSAAVTNLNYLLGVSPSIPPLAGPASLGSGQIVSPLGGTSVLNIPTGAMGYPVPVGPGIPVWGPIILHPSLSYSFSHATSVESQPGQTQDTFQQTFSAGFQFDLGTHWVLAYDPSYTIYSASAFQDTLSHSLTLRGITSYEDWTFNMAQSYYSTSQSLLETGTQTSQEAYETSVGAAYQMSSRLSLQMGADESIRDTTGFNNVVATSGNVGLSYQLTPRLKTGITFAGGYNHVSIGSSMPFEELQGTIGYQIGQKLNVFVSGGAEELQFVHPTAPSLITPVFAASLQYQLFPNTSLSITGSRSVTPSFFGNQVEISTVVGASIRQVLSKKWSVALSAGYTTEPLTSIVAQPLPQFFIGAAPRGFLVEDEVNHSTSIGMTVSYAVLERLSLSAYWSVNDTTSSQANFKYTSTQVGFSAAYTY